MKVSYVNVYHVSLAYGGPEEGGWWYDVGEAIKSLPTSPRKAKRLAEKVQAWCERRNREEGCRPRYSVLSSGEYECYVEDDPAADFPPSRPHYE